MGDSKIPGLYLAMVFGSIAIIGISLFQADLFRHYGVSDTGMGYLNQSEGIIEQVGKLNESLNRKPTGIAPLDTFIVGVYSASQLFFGVGDLYSQFAYMVADVFQIPAAIVNLIVIAVMAMIIFGIFSIVSYSRL